MIEISQSTQFKIRQLEIVSKVGTIDVSGIFDELNIYDSIMMPCMSGNIIIRDALGLSSRLYFDGSEYLNINIGKENEEDVTSFKKTFRIYRQSDRKNINQTSEMYVLHFVSEELIYSKQQKIIQTYTGNHHEAAVSILKDYLKVKQVVGKIGIIEPSKGIHTYNFPNMSPFEALNWLAQRAISNEGLSNFIFFQNKLGYNFVSLSKLITQNVLFDVNFNPKNLTPSLAQELIGARDVRIGEQHNLIDNIQNGVYAGTFIGFDPLTRKITTNKINFQDIYKKSKHANKNPNITAARNRDGLDGSQMYNSKISLYPFQSTRIDSSYTKSNDNITATIIDDTHNYIFQRRAIFKNLMQRKVQMVLPGNFTITSGLNLNLMMPSRAISDDNSNPYDISLSGKYLIIGARHIIKYDKHETVVEVATDSSDRPLIDSSNQDTIQAELE
jgi:hypothetical protein